MAKTIKKKFEEKLKSGAIAPDFSLLNQHSDEVSLSSLSGSKVLLYFYPRASTPGCTTQACNLRDAFPDLKEYNVKVIGVSPDLPPKLEKFGLKNTLNFDLLSDPEMKIANEYGVVGEKTMFGKTKIGIIRSAFLISEKGEISNTWYKISPKDTVPKLIEALSEA